ncbi:hypothetical protein KY289_003161 [Solanum tuberosum]|nr:hypothetical protein KY289_003161 [Solanum tuberosum]
MSRSSDTLFCVFLLLGICISIVNATATEAKTDNNKESFGTSSILSWRHHHHVPSIGCWWRPHPKKPSPPTCWAIAHVPAKGPWPNPT